METLVTLATSNGTVIGDSVGKLGNCVGQIGPPPPPVPTAGIEPPEALVSVNPLAKAAEEKVTNARSVWIGCFMVLLCGIEWVPRVCPRRAPLFQRFPPLSRRIAGPSRCCGCFRLSASASRTRPIASTPIHEATPASANACSSP